MWPFKKEKHWYDEPVAKYKIRTYINENGLAMYVPTFMTVQHTSAAGFYHSWLEYHAMYLDSHKWLRDFAKRDDIKQDEQGNEFIGCADLADAKAYVKEYKMHVWKPCRLSTDIDLDIEGVTK